MTGINVGRFQWLVNESFAEIEQKIRDWETKQDQFVALTLTDGQPLYVKPRAIVTIWPADAMHAPKVAA